MPEVLNNICNVHRRIWRCPLASALADLRAGPPLPITPGGSISINEVAAISDDGDETVVFVHGVPTHWYRSHDQTGARMAMAHLVEIGAARSTEVAAAFGVHRCTVYRARQAYREQGVEGLLEGRRGPKGSWKVDEADRERMVQLLITSVILDQHREPGKVWFQINWQTGAITQHWLVRRVGSYAGHANLDQLQDRIRDLNTAQAMDDEIAETLNAEGIPPARGECFTGPLVWMLRKKWGIPTVRVKATPTTPLRWEDGTYSVHGAADLLGVYPGTVYHWLETDRLRGCQLARGMPWQIPLGDKEIVALQDHLARARRPKREAE